MKKNYWIGTVLFLLASLFSVEQAEATVYLVDDAAEKNAGSFSTSKTYTFDIPNTGEAGVLTFDHKKQSASTMSVTVYQVINGSDNQIASFSPSTSYQTATYTLDRAATAVKIAVKGTLNKYIKNVKVAMAHYIELESQPNPFAVASTDETQTLVVHYSAIENPLTVSSDNEYFTVLSQGESTVNVGRQAYSFDVKYDPQGNEGEHTGVITVSDGSITTAIPVSGSYTRARVEGLTVGDATAATLPVSWNALAGATEYNVLATDPEDNTVFSATGLTEPACRVNGLLPETAYTVFVSAILNGSVTEAVSVPAVTGALEQVTGVELTHVDSYEFAAQWNRVSNDEVDNVIYTVDVYDAAGNWVKTMDVSQPSVTVDGLTGFTDYYFTVCAKVVSFNDAAASGALSENEPFKTAIGYPEIPAIADSDLFIDGFMARWTEVAGAVSYTLNIEGTDISVTLPAGGATEYEVRGLTAGTTYNYTVTVTDAEGVTRTSQGVVVPASTTIYILNESTEYSGSTIFTKEKAIPVELGEPGVLTFEYKKSAACFGNLFVLEVLADGTEHQLASLDCSTSYRSASFELNRSAVKLIFKTETGATMNKYWRNLKITLAHHVSKDADPEPFVQGMNTPDVTVQTIEVPYSNVEQALSASWVEGTNNGNFEIVSVGTTKYKSAYGKLPVEVRYHSDEIGMHTASLRVTDGSAAVEIPVVGYTTNIAPLTVSEVGYTTASFSWASAGIDGAVYEMVVLSESGDIVKVEEALTETEYTVTGLEQGANYIVQVSAKIVGDLKSAAVQQFIQTKVLVAPVVSVSAVDDHSFTLVWDAVQDAALYRVEIFTFDGENWQSAGEPVETTELTATLASLMPETEYGYRVTVVEAGGLEAATEMATVTTQPEIIVLVAPVPETVEVTTGSFTTRWEAVASAVKYEVTFYFGEETVSEETTELEYSLNTLSQATLYTYTVTAYNEAGESAVSERIDFTTETLQAPVVTAGDETETGFRLAWDAVEYAASYTVQLYTVVETDGEKSYTVYGEAVETQELAYEATGLSSGTTYGYKVSVADASGNVSESNVAEVTTISTSTGIDEVGNGWVKIYSVDGDLVVETVPGETISLFSSNGMLIRTLKSESYNRISVAEPIVIVRVGNTVKKISLK